MARVYGKSSRAPRSCAGPPGLSSRPMAHANVEAQAPDATVFGKGEAPVRLSELWKEGPLVALFLRHFG